MCDESSRTGIEFKKGFIYDFQIILIVLCRLPYLIIKKLIEMKPFYSLCALHLRNIALLLFLSFSSLLLTAQAHNFTEYDPGTIFSNTNGISNSLATGSLSGDYLVYIIEADFVGVGGAQTAWSSTIELEINDGSGGIWVTGRRADAGSMDNGNATKLKWSGILNSKYVGGQNFTTRFYDDYDDVSGPYTCDITNVKISIYKADSQHEFPSYTAGSLASGTSGITTALPTSGLTGDHLLYVVTADFVGTGGAQGAWSSTIELELIGTGGEVLEQLARAGSGAMDNVNATTLSWAGALSEEYVGGASLSTRFFDSYHDGAGPYTSDITNVRVEIFETINPTDFPIVNPGDLSSGNSGITTPFDPTGVADDHLFYIVKADFVGTGGAQTAWSSTIEMELNNGGSTIFKEEQISDLGAMDSGAPTTLIWSGSMTEEYEGGTPISIRFFDNYHDASGPYTSEITNVQLRTYPAANVSVPIELISFEVVKMAEDVKVEWKATNEYGNAFYTVERSIDGENWREVGQILSKEYTSDINEYEFVDRDPVMGINYYRLKQTDFDGKFTISNVEKVTFADLSISIFPNPSSGIITVTNNGTSQNLTVYNSIGQKVKFVQFENSKMDIDLSSLPKGIYQIVTDHGSSYNLILK